MAKKIPAFKKLVTIKNDSRVDLFIELDCHEFSWNCPATQQVDFGRVFITYTPFKKIAETKSLKAYLVQYRYKNAFNEELAVRILQDLVYYLEPMKMTVRLIQTSRGGIQNTSIASWDYEREQDKEAAEEYKPKATFQGGWAMEKEK